MIKMDEVVAEDSASYTLIAILDKNMTKDEKHPNHVVDPRGYSSPTCKTY